MGVAEVGYFKSTGGRSKARSKFLEHTFFFLAVVAGVAGDGYFGNQMRQTNSKISLKGHFLFGRG